MKIKVISWNIAGGHKIASLNHFNYQPEDINYFVDEIKKLKPNAICLQEVHTSEDQLSSNAIDIANKLKMKVLLNTPNSPSHIEKNFLLGNAIISDNENNNLVKADFPDPEGQLFWKNGDPAVTHKKNLQVIFFNNFSLVNNQMLPVKLFGFDYIGNERGQKLTTSINEVMKKYVKTPVIWCGDFNFDAPLQLYEHMNNLSLKEALPDVSTRPTKDGLKRKPDHIFYSPEFKLLDSGVVQTQTDHYLCYAEFEI